MNKKYTNYGKKNELNMKLTIALARTAGSEDRMTQAFLRPFDLTLPQFSVLEALYHLGDLKICEIIEKTLSTSGNMTVVIRNLEASGYIERFISPEDKRVSKITLTSKGHDLIEKIFPLHLESLETYFEGLTDLEKEQLLALLKKLNGK